MKCPIKLVSLFLISTFPIWSYSESTWINVVGIDSQNTSQNDIEFYDNANDFLKACKQNSKRKCVNFIDPDISKMSMDEGTLFSKTIVGAEFDKKYDFNKSQGSADKEAIFKSIRKAIKESRKNDQIIISLNNHGGPDISGKSPSCIIINSTE
jgi:hypothetical protein